ncbi:hypothetical protein MTR_5g052150 [Medicago truncatula]|uniref:Uncharacterized protein n=1 Tax=Medicago truncatula TaxID=3880 RepID=A0A072UDV2_MEDTR|nr:hypothetical protein MTR_5g052150 [Medicago truncatula]
MVTLQFIPGRHFRSWRIHVSAELISNHIKLGNYHRIGVTPKSALAKKKVVVFADEPPPPPSLGSLTDSDGDVVVASSYAEDWKRFREVGLLDEAAMKRKDDEAITIRKS